MRIRATIMTPNMLLVSAWARVKPATCSAGTCVPTVGAESPAQVTVYHATLVRPAMQGILEMNVLIMPPHLGTRIGIKS